MRCTAPAGLVLTAGLALGCGTDQSGPGGPGSAPVSVVWTFCDASNLPVWFAYQDGDGGEWTAVQPSSGAVSYAFTVSHAVGAVAWVTVRAGGFQAATEVHFAATTELAADGAAWCVTHPDRSKILSASVAGLPNGSAILISIGSAVSTALFNDFPIELAGVASGPQDLTAVESGNGLPPSVAVLRRALSLASGSAIPVLDFGSTEPLPLRSAALTIGNTNGEPTSTLSYAVTEHGRNLLAGHSFETRAGPDAIYGMASLASVSGDLFLVQTTSLGANRTRGAIKAFATWGDQSVTLGPPLATPTVATVATTPYFRPRVSGVIQSPYSSSLVVTLQESSTTSTGSVQATFVATRSYLGNATRYDLAFPDFTGVSGWQTAWALQPGGSLYWAVNASGTNGPVRDGYVELDAAIGGVVSP